MQQQYCGAHESESARLKNANKYFNRQGVVGQNNAFINCCLKN